jgi:hypothetical protein
MPSMPSKASPAASRAGTALAAAVVARRELSQVRLNSVSRASA